jgi:hypothetical protein
MRSLQRQLREVLGEGKRGERQTEDERVRGGLTGEETNMRTAHRQRE